MNKSWRTTLGGYFSAVGLIMTQTPSPEWVAPVGAALAAVGAVLTGTNARDNKVTSEEATS